MNVMRHDFNLPARAGAEKEWGAWWLIRADSLLLVWKNRAKVIGILVDEAVACSRQLVSGCTEIVCLRWQSFR